jgi:hypothetical protein
MNIADAYNILDSLSKSKEHNCYVYEAHPFVIRIWTSKIQDFNQVVDDKITDYHTVDVSVYQLSKNKLENYICLVKHDFFKNYMPIKYAVHSNGIDMPIQHLCELIKYINSLSNLCVFM